MKEMFPVCSNDEAFIKSMVNIPTPDRETEIQMFHDWYQTNNRNIAQRIILSHMKFVVYIASNYKHFNVSNNDLIQQGSIGLMNALTNFDISKGIRFATYAAHHIKYSISEYIIKNVKIAKIATTKAQRKLFYNLNRYIDGAKKWLSSKEKQYVANELNVKVKDVETMEARLTQNDCHITYIDNDEDTWEPYSYKESWISQDDETLEDNFIESVENNYQLEILQESFKDLNEREKDIIQKRFMNEDKSTLMELSQQYNVSCERVRQLENSALKKLKKSFKGMD